MRTVVDGGDGELQVGLQLGVLGGQAVEARVVRSMLSGGGGDVLLGVRRLLLLRLLLRVPPLLGGMPLRGCGLRRGVVCGYWSGGLGRGVW